MVRAETVAAVRATCEAIVRRHGVELVELSLRGEGKGLVLRVTVDRVADGDPLSVDEIAKLSEEISRALDVDDPIEGRYTLEVSSAGLERPLVKVADYERFRGRTIRLKTLEEVAGRKVFRGSIESSDSQEFEMRTEEGELVSIPFSMVGKANLVVDWNAELRRAT